MTKYSKSEEEKLANCVSPIVPLGIGHGADTTAFVLARESPLPIRSMNCKTRCLYSICLDVEINHVSEKQCVAESDVCQEAQTLELIFY